MSPPVLGYRRLLTNALAQMRNKVGAKSIFFVEDTSLRINGLSSELDYPGLQVKEWFKATTFDELDGLLDQNGGDRSCVVKSDIGLHLPNLKRPIFFRGSSSGKVAREAPTYERNQLYPWLTPDTFNGWFVPDGGTRTLGEMGIEESWRFDFRTQALEELLDRLEEYAAVINLPSSTFAKAPRVVATSKQQQLFGDERKIFIVVGKVCAGKSTFGMRSKQNGLHWVEASQVLKTFRNEYDSESLDGADFAERVLDDLGQDVVAAKILDLYSDKLDDGIAVTGFRTIEELETFRSRVPETKVILIESLERERFKRHLARGRHTCIDTIGRFRQHDREQLQFGLLRVAEEFADFKIVNDKPLDDYFHQIDTLVLASEKKASGVVGELPKRPKSKNRLYRCLKILEELGRPVDCEEIERESTKSGLKITHNNVNKVLKNVPELAKRYEVDFERIRYQITDSGRAYLRLLLSSHEGEIG